MPGKENNLLLGCVPASRTKPVPSLEGVTSFLEGDTSSCVWGGCLFALSTACRSVESLWVSSGCCVSCSLCGTHGNQKEGGVSVLSTWDEKKGQNKETELRLCLCCRRLFRVRAPLNALGFKRLFYRRRGFRDVICGCVSWERLGRAMMLSYAGIFFCLEHGIWVSSCGWLEFKVHPR